MSFVFCAFVAVSISAQTTEFTYQGSLTNSGLPANGNFDFEFALFDTLSGGNPIVATIPKNNVPVTNGIFSVKLDFGSVFPGGNRFLEIRVRPAGQPGITTLGPRQLIDSAPYSIKASLADIALSSLQLGGVPSTEYVLTTDPRMSDARQPTAGSTDYIQNGTAQQASSNFRISGTGTANIFNAGTQYNIGGNRVLSISVAQSNVFAGPNAGLQNTTGAANTFFGSDAGFLNTTGDANSFFGEEAGVLNTSGIQNSFFGRAAGRSNTTGGSNAFFGTSAGRANSVGGSNAFFGNEAGFANIASSNSFFGARAGFTNTTGTDNAFFGAGAGLANTTASSNAFFGHVAGFANTTGVANSFFGKSAGQSNTTGASNSFFGQRAGFANTTGADNAFFGGNAGELNTTGFGNAFFGRNAGNSNTIGIANSFFGGSAGDSNTTGSNNTFYGNGAGISNTIGDGNTFVGTLAGNGNDTGGSNTIIGDHANVLVSNLTNATAIGSRAAVSQSNSLILGGITGVNSGTDTSVGIGTTAPTNLLTIGSPEATIVTGKVGVFGTSGFNVVLRETTNDVEGIMGVNSSSGVIYGSMTNHDVSIRTNNTNRIVIDAGGNVGVGTSGPNDKLDVNGTIGIAVLGVAGSTSLCRNASDQIASCSSSLRYKTNIGQFSQGLSFVNKLRPITFDWKDGGMKDVGFGAEDVANIDPRFVTYNDKGEVEGVKYDRLSVAFVNAFKEQQEQIETLQKTNVQQQQQIEKQQAFIESIEKRLEQLEKEDRP